MSDVVNPLKLPLPPTETEAVGIFQGDIIVRTAIISALEDLRANPWLLDFCFASLPRDSLTLSAYGQKEVERAKEWFTKHNIEVSLGVRPYDSAPPAYMVSIHLMGSIEEANTLADIHHTTMEEWEASWNPISPKFSPVSYDAATGRLEVPSSITDTITLSTSMAIVDKTGKKHTILNIDDNFIELTPNTVADFNNCFLRPAFPAYIASLESARFKETFILGCHAIGEPVHLTYLHAIISFCLLRYRQSLLEARGLQVTSISSSDFKSNDVFDDAPEQYFSRYITLSGSVHHVWPKHVDARILSLQTTTEPSDAWNDEELNIDTLG